MYDVSEGTIKNRRNRHTRHFTAISPLLTRCVVLQETFLFSGTIYNICYAKPSATRDEVITAAKAAGAHSFIMKLPNAYNTKVVSAVIHSQAARDSV